MTAKRCDIAVIGAGMAGISCTRQLAAAGREVVIFDKSKGMGGRMATRRGDGFSFDHGAQYFTARTPEFVAALTHWQQAGWCAPWSGRVVTLADDGQPRELAPEARFVGTPGMSALCRALASGLPVQHRLRLLALQRSGSGWQLAFDDGSQWQAQQVVLAIPPAQAAPLLAALPALQTRAAAVEMQPCWAAMLLSDRPLSLAFDAAFIGEGPLSWVARNNSKPARPAMESWVLHANPAWSAQHVDDDPAQVAQALCAALAGHCGGSLSPHQLSAHRWLYAQAANPLPDGFLLQDGVGVAGDWCLGKRVEDAYLSGTRLADALLAAH
ncbi:hypothetical protein ACG97_04190 [Vogesella sp. EB]|uniref:NAD(P)/FAD-dependent oxidoreductase n=1 Tax=Vogesella sp. EB TaxID=1526735 RepID=UPI00064D53F5|nr:FAD-dependent oxidoreductase [Vogesella sp. EB]KMJ54289.1 hypothetical protein ACG97_04190 [Vogesella sp. EB]